jgi:hypothetical protein
MRSFLSVLFPFRHKKWRPVRYWRNECVHRAMDGHHVHVGVKIVVGEESPEGERRIRIHSAPLRFWRKRGAAWEEAKRWQAERKTASTPQLTPWVQP